MGPSLWPFAGNVLSICQLRCSRYTNSAYVLRWQVTSRQCHALEGPHRVTRNLLCSQTAPTVLTSIWALPAHTIVRLRGWGLGLQAAVLPGLGLLASAHKKVWFLKRRITKRWIRQSGKSGIHLAAFVSLLCRCHCIYLFFWCVGGTPWINTCIASFMRDLLDIRFFCVLAASVPFSYLGWYPLNLQLAK